MEFKNPYWSKKTKIELLQKWIIVHSAIYYELNDSIVSDTMYDNNCNQLMEYIKRFPKSFRRSLYYPVFKDFDGSTGFHLFTRLQAEQQWDFLDIAKKMIKLRRKIKNGKNKKKIRRQD